ncbi:serine hydrolase [Streptomyces sp. NPDC059853]|uniref:serine hydrolase n=1 Tax=Streptomyces sp. NPDC059853 TaxID=3346973 RepID=UPI00364FDF18
MEEPISPRRPLAARARRWAVPVVTATAVLALGVAGDVPRGEDLAVSTQSPAVEPAPGSGGGNGEGSDLQALGRLPATPADAALARSLQPLLAEQPRMRMSVCVLALESGESAAYGTGVFDTASIVKVDVLAALLLQTQDAGRELTERERTLAAAMIQQSDNDATDVLWRVIGRQSGLDAANARLGLTATTGGAGGHWGLTQTTGADQLTLLRQIFGPAHASVLDTTSRDYLRLLMGTVIPEQQWGISAAGSGGAVGTELKNGWLPRSTTGLWDVNSIGRVTVEGRSYLIAVVSDGHPDYESGVAAVESAAREAVSALSAGPRGQGV